MSAPNNSDNEEYIAPAPSFCKRIRTEDLPSEVAKSTREGLEQLYEDVVDKLGSGKKENRDSKEMATYTKMIQQAKLVEAIDDFFHCEEERQKAKFMNMLIETNRNVDKLAKYEEKISSMEKTIEDLRENEEHLNDVIDGYKDSEEDYKNKIKKFRDRVIVQESLISNMKKKINTKNMYITQFVIVIGAYVLFRLYS
jgi:predicted RNase H-like nuclease (RuvC/YqgF family)